MLVETSLISGLLSKTFKKLGKNLHFERKEKERRSASPNPLLAIKKTKSRVFNEKLEILWICYESGLKTIQIY